MDQFQIRNYHKFFLEINPNAHAIRTEHSMVIYFAWQTFGQIPIGPGTERDVLANPLTGIVFGEEDQMLLDSDVMEPVQEFTKNFGK